MNASRREAHVLRPSAAERASVAPSSFRRPGRRAQQAGWRGTCSQLRIMTRMEGLVRFIEPRCTSVKSIVKMGIVWAEVLRAVDELKPDQLDLGTHGRRGLKRAILGSVAEKLVRSVAGSGINCAHQRRTNVRPVPRVASDWRDSCSCVRYERTTCRNHRRGPSRFVHRLLRPS